MIIDVQDETDGIRLKLSLGSIDLVTHSRMQHLTNENFNVIKNHLRKALTYSLLEITSNTESVIP